MPRSPHRIPLSAHLLRTALGGFLIITGLGAAPAAGQSFDCRNARYADERAICRHPGLGQLDQELASAYDRVMRKLPKEERDVFDNNETAFVTARRRCGDHPACIEQSYRNRIQELQAAVPEDPGRHADPRRSDRLNKPDEPRAKTEDDRGELSDGKHGAADAANPGPDRKTEQGEVSSATALSPPAPTDKRSRHKERASTVSALPAAPPEPERQPASAATAAAVSERHSEKPHAKTKAVATGAPAQPGPNPAPAQAARGSGGSQWVNPSPSP
jgi:uncharacterized protein